MSTNKLNINIFFLRFHSLKKTSSCSMLSKMWGFLQLHFLTKTTFYLPIDLSVGRHLALGKTFSNIPITPNRGLMGTNPLEAFHTSFRSTYRQKMEPKGFDHLRWFLRKSNLHFSRHKVSELRFNGSSMSTTHKYAKNLCCHL